VVEPASEGLVAKGIAPKPFARSPASTSESSVRRFLYHWAAQAHVPPRLRSAAASLPGRSSVQWLRAAPIPPRVAT
jgi:hypothetical protein